MASWRNADLVLFHGTDTLSLRTINSIDIAACQPRTDFGQGFYTTTNRHQAEQWANMRARRGASTAAVVRFDVDRDQLAAKEILAFVRPTADFWDFVTDCRNGVAPHQRKALSQGQYDVVFGPVTLWPQRLTVGDSDQVSFHTNAATALLASSMVLTPRAGKQLF